MTRALSLWPKYIPFKTIITLPEYTVTCLFCTPAFLFRSRPQVYCFLYVYVIRSLWNCFFQLHCNAHTTLGYSTHLYLDIFYIMCIFQLNAIIFHIGDQTRNKNVLLILLVQQFNERGTIGMAFDLQTGGRDFECCLCPWGVIFLNGLFQVVLVSPGTYRRPYAHTRWQL